MSESGDELDDDLAVDDDPGDEDLDDVVDPDEDELDDRTDGPGDYEPGDGRGAAAAALADRLLGVEPEELDEHGIAKRFWISWDPPTPLIVAIGSFLGGTFGVAIIYSMIVQSMGLAQGPTGAGAVTGQIVGQVATGQPTEVTVGLVEITLPLRALLQFLLAASLAGPALLVAKRQGAGWKADLGLEVRARDIPIGLAVGALCQVLVWVFYWGLSPFIDTSTVDEPARALTDQATDVVGIVLVTVMTLFLAPIAEEIYYRGLVLRAAERRYGATAALIGSAVFFALTHGLLLQFPALLLFGLLLAAIALRTGRLSIPIIAHLAFNLVTVIVLLAFPGAPV